MNFIDVDNYITSFLHKNMELYKESKTRLELFESIEKNKLGGKILSDIEKDKNILNDLRFSENILFIYKRHANPLIKNFLNILKTPIHKNAKETLNSADITKKKILYAYMNVIKMYIPYDIYQNLDIDNENNIDLNINYCPNCENTEEFIKENEVLICNKCFSEIIKMAYYNNRSYNISVNRCNYDRISHFKECLKQYQGKQNTFISPKVYKDLEHALTINGIVNKKEENREKKFANVKKTHIIYFLKELGYTKHYDDYVLIYTNLTGKSPNNISDLEESLISDFEKISDQYSLLYNSVERKNFINIQFILYKLLQKHNYHYEDDDFITLKSVDKKMERDKICRKIFESLNWEYK